MAGDGWNHVVVRDGRRGHDPALGNEEAGDVLMEFDADKLYGRYERLTLPDGSEVKVIGARWGTTGHTSQTLFVGDVD